MATPLSELYESPLARSLKLRAAGVDPSVDEQELNRAGAVGSLFKFLGRTSGASAEAAYALTDKDPNTSFLGGVKKGLTGHADKSYRDVLKENFGIGGAVGAIAGFGLDVVGDPLTYIGAKKIKGISEPEAIIQAIKGASDNVDAEAARIMAESPTRVGLTVSGKPFGSGKFFGVGIPDSGIAEKLLGPSTDRKLVAKMFSKQAELPLGLKNASRVIDNSHNAAYSNFRNQIYSLYEGLSREERRDIYLALDKGEALGSTPVDNPGATKFKTLGEYVQASRKIQDSMFRDEGNLGLFKQKVGTKGAGVEDFEGYRPNYVYRFYDNPPLDAIKNGQIEIPNKIAGSEKAGFMKKRTADVTAEEAEALGWKPVTDIGEAMDMRAGKHYRSMAAGAQMRDAIDQFSISGEDLERLGNQSSVKKLGWVQASKMDGPVAAKYGDRYVPEFVAKTMNTAWDTYKGETTGAKALKLHDKIMRNWKFGNTALMPGYHVRNSFGDLMLNVADGVVNPQRYQQAFKVINDRRHINDRALADMVGGDLSDLGVPEGSKVIRMGGQHVPTDRVFDLYNQSGAKSGLITSEIQRSMSDFERKTLGNRLSRAKAKVGDWSDTREDFFRLSHFIDATDDIMKKGKGKIALEDAAMEAGKRVRKFNIDYGDLSNFERNVMNRIVPFYTFMRKSTPLNMELLLTKPGVMALYPKGQNMLQGIMGTEDANGEQLIPDWIREMAPVRLALGKEEDRNWFQRQIAGAAGAGNNEAAFLNLAGEQGGLAPLGALSSVVGAGQALAQGNVGGALGAAAGPLQSGISPLITTPIELGTGRQLFNGQPIGNTGGYAVDKLLGGPGRLGRDLNNDFSGSIGPGLLRTLIAPAHVATGARQEGEFMRRQDIAGNRKESAKLNLLKKRFPDWDNMTEARQEALKRTTQTVKGPEDIRAQRQRRYLTQILGQ